MHMTKKMILGGGCFWCVEHDMREAVGVLSVVSGYSGDGANTPSYEDHRGFREAILVEYDDMRTTYKKLLQYFIDHIDPTDPGGQFADRGDAYMPTIYFENEEEKRIAEGVIAELNASGVYDKPSAVQIIPIKPFFKAEEYHQDFAGKNPSQYARYRRGSGREDFVQGTCQIREEKNIQWSE